MKNRGKNCRKAISVLFQSLIGLLISSSSYGQFYFVNTYAESNDTLNAPYPVQLLAIDLEQNAIADSLELFQSGSIINKKPAVLVRNNNAFLVAFSIDGPFAKNSITGLDNYIIRYAIIQFNDRRLNFIKSDSIIGGTIKLLEQYPNENGIRMSVIGDRDNIPLFATGIYSINAQNRFRLERRVPINEIPESIGNLNGFGLLRKVWGDNVYHLYHSFHNTQYWLVKLDSARNAILDSLQLRYSGGQATVYAFHPERNRFYCFHLNYEMHGEYVTKNRQDYYTNPEVLIIDPVSLDIEQTIPVNDYPEGDYPGKENGLADVVGDYIVYYFFQDDWMGIYAPAMLFIFDTRTNETTWLRVGWR